MNGYIITIIIIVVYICPIFIMLKYFERSDAELRNEYDDDLDGVGVIKLLISFIPVVNFAMCCVIFIYYIIDGKWKNKQD